MKKYIKIHCFKTTEALKKCGYPFVPTIIYYEQREKNIEKAFFVSAGPQKGEKNRGFWEYFTTISTESKK